MGATGEAVGTETTMAAEVALFPDLSYWFGLGFEELCRMPNWALRLYARALNRLLAGEESMMARAVAFPHLKKSARSRYAQQLAQRAKQGAPKHEPRKMPLGQMETALPAIGIGFTREPRKGGAA